MNFVVDADVLFALARADSETSTLAALTESARRALEADASVSILLGTDGRPSLMAYRSSGVAPAHQIAERPAVPAGPAEELLGGRILIRLDRGDVLLGSLGIAPSDQIAGPLIGVPMNAHGQTVGALLVARHPNGDPFSEADELLLQTLATASGEIVQRARRHRALELLSQHLWRDENASRSDEEHGSSVVRRLLAVARSVIGTDLAFVSRISEEREDVLYIDADPGAPALDEGVSFPPSQGYCELMLSGSIAPSVPDLRANPLTASLPVTKSLALGAYCGTPINLPDGRSFGTLCGISSAPSVPLTNEQLTSLATIADLIGAQLAIAEDNQEMRDAERSGFLNLLTDQRRRVRIEPIVDLTSGQQTASRVSAEFLNPWGGRRDPELVFDEAADLGLSATLERDDLVKMTQARDDIEPGSRLWLATSARALLDTRNRALLSTVLAEQGHDVTIEIIWSEPAVPARRLKGVLDDFRRYGASIAVRQEGASRAELDSLLDLHPEAIVLHPSLTGGTAPSPQSRATIAALTSVAEDMGAVVVAMNVEQQAELDTVFACGVRAASGGAVPLSGPADLDRRTNMASSPTSLATTFPTNA